VDHHQPQPDAPILSVAAAARERIGRAVQRDTAGRRLAAQLVLREDPDATLVVMPADHLIQPPEAFQAAIRQAAALVEAQPETLVTFGIKPTYPAETFGYIERGAASGRRQPPDNSAAQFDVARFREKPARSIAEEYLASGKFYWNSGIFVWKARTILEAIGRYEPEMHEYLRSIGAAIGQPDFISVLDRDFTAIRGKSIDFAVMERYQPVVVIEAPFTWDDVGSWQALARSVGVDSGGNAVLGRHLGIRTRDSIIRSTNEHLVVTLGMNDCIVVHTPDATLVADKQQEEAIREVAGGGRRRREFVPAAA
jgi:mannose-1-phosphate guanylyltransferase